MHCGRGRERQQVLVAPLVLKCAIGENKPGRAVVDRSYRRAPRKRLHDLAHLRPVTQARCRIQNILLVRDRYILRLVRGKGGTAYSGGNRHLLSGRLQLAQSFVAEEEECFVLLDWAADRQSVLPKAKWRNRGIAGEVVIVIVAGVEDRVSKIPENRTVIVVGAALGFDINLAACLRAILDIVDGAVHAIFLNRILGDLQASLRFLGLLLNAAGVYAVDGKIVVIAGAACEPDRALVASTIILRERREQSEARPVAAIVGKF